MNGDVKIDLGSAIQLGVDKVLELVGKDSVTRDFEEKLGKQFRASQIESSSIQIIGMHQPLPIEEIFQPLRLKFAGQAEDTVGSLVEMKKDFIIRAGPGQGKTTLLRWLYRTLMNDHRYVAILYTLRRSDAIENLREFIKYLGSGKTPRKTRRDRVILLVDGYDELDKKSRKAVSEALVEFQSLKRGNFFLTCRYFYSVYDVNAVLCEIEAFNKDDAIKFIEGFSSAYGTKIDSGSLLTELSEHNLFSFVAHPLLLALVCILKSGPLPALPRNTIGLIRRAIDTLTFRWDEAKGISRETSLPLDGEERVRCLMRIAYEVGPLICSDAEVIKAVEKQLKLSQLARVNIRDLMTEIAQFYGILVPTDESTWEFTHRCMGDYLAARFWVETGRFHPLQVREWNARAAYAACMLTDATGYLEVALSECEDVSVFTECLYNNVPLDPEPIARAVISHYDKYGKRFRHSRDKKCLTVETEEDFYDLVGDELLDYLLLFSLSGRKISKDLILAYVLDELRRRGFTLVPTLYNQLCVRFGSEDFQLSVARRDGTATFNVSEFAPPAP